jgi:hypothetical protein
MSNFPLSARGRVPGPIGADQTYGTRPHLPHSEASLLRDSPRSPEHEPSKGLRIVGPYPRISVTEGYVAGDPGKRAFHATSRCEHFEGYGSLPQGHTHTDIYLAPYLSSGQSAYAAIIPDSVEGASFQGSMHYKIPASSKVFTTIIPFKERAYHTSDYTAELAALKKENPNAALFVQVHGLKNPRVEVIGFDPSSATHSLPPRQGREVMHLYSNSAYSSIQSGTLSPHPAMASAYSGQRFGAMDELRHRNATTYSKELAHHLQGLIGQGVGLKICAWNNTEREMMIPPAMPSRVTSGTELTNSGALPFHYLDSVHRVTAHTIHLKPGESFSATHPALAHYVAENPLALHMCREHTDYQAPGKPKRIEIVSIE